MNTPRFVRSESDFNFSSALEEAREHPAYWQEDILVDVAHHLARELESRKMTQADLASKLGVKPGYISRVLRGHENLTLKTLAKIAFILGKRWECMLVSQGDHIALFSCYASSSPDSDMRTIHRAETTTIPIAGDEESDDDMSEYGEEKRYA